MATTATRTIYARMSDGSEKILSGIPANARVTFGKVQPGDKNDYDRTYCLRIYTTLSNQLAVITGVKEFRDSSITVQRKVAQTKAKQSRINTGKAVEDKAEQVTEYVYVDE